MKKQLFGELKKSIRQAGKIKNGELDGRSSCFVSVFGKDGKMRPVEVDYDVYVYIRQLENCVKHPNLSKLKALYPQRFAER